MRTTILGLQGSGKSYMVKNCILPAYGEKALVFDVMDEYKGFERYVPKFVDDRSMIQEEVALFIQKLVIPNSAAGKKQKIWAIVFDEADLYAPATEKVAPGLRNLVVKSRHYGLDLFFITRRPTDISAYIMDTSDYLICGKQVGTNALRTISNINLEAREVVQTLDFDKHEFVVFDREREFKRITVSKDCKTIPKLISIETDKYQKA